MNLDPSRNEGPVTYHDSCNLGRKGGLFEEPRRVLRAVTEDFREMMPNRTQNFCCGGGAGLVAIDDWNESRIQSGKTKADQIRETGARTVVTSCDNCRHQILELGDSFGLGTTVSSLSEMTANALVVPSGENSETVVVAES